MRSEVRVSEIIAHTNHCRRKAYIQYELGYGDGSIEAGIGTVFHELLAVYYGGEPSENTKLDDPEAEATVQAMYNTYVQEAKRRSLDAAASTLHTELRIGKQLVDGMLITGQVDRIYEEEYVIVVQDHKTTGQFFETAQRDIQLMAYLWMVADLYPHQDLFAIEHNLVKRNKRTSRAKPPFIQRNRHYVSREELNVWAYGWLSRIFEYRENMRHAEQSELGVGSQYLYPNGQNDCAWRCSFSDICGMVDDPEADFVGALVTEFTPRDSAPGEIDVVVSTGGQDVPVTITMKGSTL